MMAAIIKWNFLMSTVFMIFLYFINFSTWFPLLFSNKKVQGIEVSLPSPRELESFPDNPIQLVQPDPHHKGLSLVKKNVKYLQMIKGPVATVAVVGKFNTGKSFLLNQLMGKEQGFGIGPYVTPQTMGIWMWGRPVVMELASKMNVSVIFLDTEGFAANNVSEGYDAKIFSVATLISSHLLYNSIKIIDQADIDYLELLARRTQLFALRSQMSRAKWTDEFIHDLLSFPPLIWVVQDFVQVTEGGETHKEWLHRLMDTRTRETEDYSISLLDIFQSVDCHTLFLPAVKKSLLLDLSKAKESDLTEEYRDERDELIAKLKKEIVPKEKNNKPITGVELATLLEILVAAANEGSLSEVPSRWNAFIERLKQTATEDCYKFYETEISGLMERNNGGPINVKDLEEFHEQTLSKSVHLLFQLLRGLEDAIAEAKKKLLYDILQMYHRTKDLNDKKLKLRCSELQHASELEADQSLQTLDLPVLTTSLHHHVTSVVSNAQEYFVTRIANLVPSDVQKPYLESIKNTVESMGEGLELKNQKALDATFQSAVAQSIEKFVKYSRNTGVAPRKPPLLVKIIEESNFEAIKNYEQLNRKYEEENLYKLHLSDLKNQIAGHSLKLSTENEELVKRLVIVEVEKFKKQFEDQTSPVRLVLPLNDEDLQSRLRMELNRIEREYHDALDGFTDYEAPFKGLTELKVKLEEICQQRNKENVEAFMREIEIPLNRAKQLILLSADKYTTVFSLMQYIKSVCLLNLNEGQPKLWSRELKERIIERFIEKDVDLTRIVNSRKGFWSTFYGFFQWIFWYFYLS